MYETEIELAYEEEKIKLQKVLLYRTDQDMFID